MILQVDNVTLRFGGLRALDKISFSLQQREILGIIGPNGAGKTTLFNVIAGVYHPNAGRVIFQDKDITRLAPYRIARLGIARTHQVVRPLGELSVKENVIVGACFGHDNLALADADEVADRMLEFVGLAQRSAMLASTLNVVQKKRMEMARSLAARPALLLLDEVLAGLNPQEIADMIGVVKKIRDQGITVITIEHLMHAILNVSDRIVVLDYGKKIAEGTPSEVSNNEQVIQAYLGDPKVAQRLLEGLV